MNINPKKLLPSQDFLKPGTIAYIKTCINEGKEDELPPDPIVRKNGEGLYVVIDGHNLAAVMTRLGRTMEVVEATTSGDYAANESQASQTRAAELRKKFDSCLEEQQRVALQGIRSFNDLLEKYPTNS